MQCRIVEIRQSVVISGRTRRYELVVVGHVETSESLDTIVNEGSGLIVG
jgi:hypothetical protein